MMEVGGSEEGKKRVMTNQEVKTSKQQQALLRYLRVVLVSFIAHFGAQPVSETFTRGR